MIKKIIRFLDRMLDTIGDNYTHFSPGDLKYCNAVV